jgi:hypothetical protein
LRRACAQRPRIPSQGPPRDPRPRARSPLRPNGLPATRRKLKTTVRKARAPHRGAHIKDRLAVKQRGRPQPQSLRFSSRSPLPPQTVPQVAPVDNSHLHACHPSNANARPPRLASSSHGFTRARPALLSPCRRPAGSSSTPPAWPRGGRGRARRRSPETGARARPLPRLRRVPRPDATAADVTPETVRVPRRLEDAGRSPATVAPALGAARIFGSPDVSVGDVSG